MRSTPAIAIRRTGHHRLRLVAVVMAMMAALVVCAPPARADHSRALVVQSVFPNGMAALSESEERIAAGVASLTGGTLSLRFVGAGAIIPPAHLLEAVRAGTVPVGYDWMGYHARRIPVAGLVASMPFGPPPRDLASWLYGGGGLTLVESAYERMGVVVLPCHMVVSEAGGWFNREIRSVDDLKGLRMRIAGLGGKVLERLGGIPSREPVNKLYDALADGRLDAVEFSVPATDQSFGFEAFTRYYYFPGWHQPASLNALLVNPDVWNGLSDSEQAALRATCRETVLWGMTAGVTRQVEALDTAAERGAEVRRFPDAVLARLREVSEEVVAETAGRDPMAAEALASLTRHLERVRRWDALQALPR